MKRVVSLFLILFPFPLFAQDYDEYRPHIYNPCKYVPKTATWSNPYEKESVPHTVGNLKVFNKEAKLYPGLRWSFLGDLEEYAELYEKCQTKNRSADYIIKKKQMRYFQHDWDVLFSYKRGLFEKDSLDHRKKFVADSIRTRENFVLDSIEYRRHFVADSIYRDDYRKRHNYDYVAFDGPHGSPVLCYRKGKIIDGEIKNKYNLPEKIYKNGILVHEYTYNKYQLLEKEYENGVLIHEYKYSPTYLYDMKKIRYLSEGEDDYWEKEGRLLSHYGPIDGRFIYDSVQQILRFYYYKKNQFHIDRVLYFEMREGERVEIKRQVYSEGRMSEEETYEYYPNTFIIRSKNTFYFSGLEKWKIVLVDYYSSGDPKCTKEYHKNPSGDGLILRSVTTYKDGYREIDEYDFDGKLERSYTKWNY